MQLQPMSHDVAYTRRLFLSLLSTITTILLGAQQGTPQTDHRHFVLNCVCGCDQCRLTSRTSRDPMALPLATPSPLSTVTTILLSAQQGTPQTDHGISS